MHGSLVHGLASIVRGHGSLFLWHGSIVLLHGSLGGERHGCLGGHDLDIGHGETDRRSGQDEASNCGDSSHESVLINIIISFFNQIC